MTPKMSEPEALREKDENNQETNDEDAVSKRKVLRYFKIKYNFIHEAL